MTKLVLPYNPNQREQNVIVLELFYGTVLGAERDFAQSAALPVRDKAESTAPAFEPLPRSVEKNKILTEFTGSDTNVKLPADITVIGSSAFKNRTDIESVVIPEGVRTIGKYAFNGCSGLTEVMIPDSVSEIEEYAFAGCRSLTRVRLPNGAWAFSKCEKLKNISYLGTQEQWMLINIGNNAFAGKTNIHFNL